MKCSSLLQINSARLILILVLISGVLQACTQTETPTPTFDLSLASSSVAIQQGKQASVDVVIEAKNGFSAELLLSVEGLPSGVSASFNDNPTATDTSLLLTASATAVEGDYPLTIKAVSGSLEKSIALSLSIDNAASDGKTRLNINLSFPSDIEPKVELTFPDKTIQTFTQSTSLVDLEEGEYSYKTNAGSYKGTNFNFKPSSESGSVTLKEGETTTLSIAFEAQDGALRTALEGIPTDLIVIDVEGDSFAPNFRGTSQETYPYLKPGTYTIRSHNGEEVVDGITYKSETDATIEVKAGKIATATINFEAQNGKLELDLRDLFEPNDPFTDFSPAIIVRNAEDQIIMGTIREAITLEKLPPGIYSVEALDTSGSGKSFVPKAAQELQEITVVAGETATVIIEYDEEAPAPSITSFDNDACTYNEGSACGDKILDDPISSTKLTKLQWVIDATDLTSLTLEPGSISLKLTATDIVLEDILLADAESITYTLTATNTTDSVSKDLTLSCCAIGVPDFDVGD